MLWSNNTQRLDNDISESYVIINFTEAVDIWEVISLNQGVHNGVRLTHYIAVAEDSAKPEELVKFLMKICVFIIKN